MRIISKYHDYYDSVMGHGQDQGTLYLRKEEPIVDPELLKALHSPIEHTGLWAAKETAPLKRVYLPEHGIVLDDNKEFRHVFLRSRVVLFCGKVFRYVYSKLEKREHRFSPYGKYTCWQEDYFYNFKELEEFLLSLGKLVKDIYREKFSDELSRVRKLEAFLSQQETDEVNDVLIKHRIVTASQVVDTEEYRLSWDVNAPLKDIKFFKIKDPYTAFQELDMYISGVLGQQTKETINISDKDRIYQHGFDKYSFRKLPGEKGRKKNQNAS